jgi:hypothetical protein
MMARPEEIEEALEPYGLILRGGFAPSEADGAPEGARSLLLVGNAGPGMWAAFAPHVNDGPHPLDRWIERVVGAIAARFGATALYPFEGPPYWPFQRWAMRAEPVHASPLGILIHPAYGLWHAYRAALAFAGPIDLPARADLLSPCDTCEGRPCLTACPVGAFTSNGYDTATCVAHLQAAPDAACLEAACLARRACPIGRAYAYPPAQARFHLAAFLTGQR